MLAIKTLKRRLGRSAIALAMVGFAGAVCGSTPAAAGEQVPGKAVSTNSAKSVGSVVAPDLDRLPQPVTKQPVDVGSIARGFDAAGAQAAAQALARGPQLLVFVSLTMPERSLRRLIDQAERSSAALVLRGLKDGSMVKTAVAVRDLLGNRKTAIQIDPQGFDRFSVTQVPTYVLLKDGAQLRQCADTSCMPPASYAAIAGDVTIDYALEWIGARSSTFTREAQQLLQRLRE